jgi:hypothetical protein
MSHFDQDKCHCEESFDRPVLSAVEGLRINSATKQSQSSQVEIASLPFGFPFDLAQGRAQGKLFGRSQ